MKLELETVEGKVLPIDVPEHASQVKLNKYIDLSVGYKELIDWIIDQQKEGTLYDSRTYYAYRLAILLGDFFEVDIIDLLNLPVNGLVDEEGQLLPKVLKEHLNNLQNMEVPEINGTLFSIVEYLDAVVLKYEPKLIGEFEYKGETWEVPEFRVLAMNQIKYPKITVLQAIEAMEVDRVSKSIKDDGSAKYSSYLHRMALLCKKKGEDFKVEGFEERVTQRQAHFQDITMDIALDVIFFSQHILKNYLSKIVTNISSNKPHPDQGLVVSN